MNILADSQTRSNLRVCSEGVEYDYDANIWRFNLQSKNYSLNIKRLHDYATDKLYDDIKKYLAHALLKLKVGTVANIVNALNDYLVFAANNNSFVDKFCAEDVINYINKDDINIAWKVSMRVFVINMHEFGSYSVDSDTKELVSKITIKRKSSASIVLTADPVQGPYTSIEYDLLLKEILKRYNKGKIKYEVLVLSYVYNCLGLRPIQVSRLKVKDYYLKKNNDIVKYYLNVPSAKNRRYSPRAVLVEREIDKRLAALINELLERIKENHKKLDISIDFEEMPIFPNYKRVRNEVDGLEYHETPNALTRRFSDIAKKTRIISERTGKQMTVNAYRVRRTIGTRAGIEGKNVNIIAELLDHSNISSVDYYVKFAREFATEIENGIGKDIAPLISAFQGEIISDMPIAGTRHNIKSSNFDTHDVGICVNHRGCGIYSKNNELKSILAEIPFVCYTCPYFNAWNDLDTHREHLKIMISRQKELLYGFGDKPNMQNYNMSSSLDLTINSIKHVIMMIEKEHVKKSFSDLA